MTYINFADKRVSQMRTWLKKALSIAEFKLETASSDASFRRYFRVSTASETFIVMDAPPSQEDTKPFVSIANFMVEHGIHVPKIIASDVKDGFLLLSDFGSRSYLDELNEQSADYLYKSAIDSLIAMQLMPIDTISLPEYNSMLLRQEMSLFPEWFLGQHLAIASPDFLTKTFSLLADNALEQPQVFVHRDYHSRNLMHTQNDTPGIIDFQDAVVGPISYDLVSLLRDCYIEWSDDKLTQWIHYYYSQAIENKLLNTTTSIEQFTQWFDWMGLQRHLKVLGIFARLNYRDGKSNYMNDLPLTLKYVQKISKKYPEFSELSDFLQQKPIMAII
jgi:aminoglycoside/choline kinase family phosphotransferase